MLLEMAPDRERQSFGSKGPLLDSSPRNRNTLEPFDQSPGTAGCGRTRKRRAKNAWAGTRRVGDHSTCDGAPRGHPSTDMTKSATTEANAGSSAGGRGEVPRNQGRETLGGLAESERAASRRSREARGAGPEAVQVGEGRGTGLLLLRTRQGSRGPFGGTQVVLGPRPTRKR